MSLLVLVMGIGIGGGAGFGVVTLTGTPKATPSKALAAQPEEPPVFVPSKEMIAPLVFADGRLAGYVKFDIELEVRQKDVEMVSAKLPLMLHAVNMRTWRTPLATGPDGLLADIGGIRAIVAEAAVTAFGRGTVKHVAVTRAEPA